MPTPARHRHGRGRGPARVRVPVRVVLAAVLGAVFFWLAAAPPAAAQETEADAPNEVLEIHVEGNTNIGRGEILSQIGTDVGGPLSTRQITEDIKAIYALGYFTDVRVEAEPVPGEGYLLTFEVDEKPRIASIRLRGVNRVETSDILEALPLKAGGFYTKSQLEADVQAIKDAYREKGYLQVKVTPRLEPVEGNAFDVVFDVEERPRYYITDIRIRGTEVFSELELIRRMRTAEVDCFDWINDSGVYNTDKINQDLQVIVAEYLRRGYIRVFIDKPEITLIHNPEFTRIKVEITVSEGAQYFTGEVDIEGDILGEKADLLDRLGLVPGEVYNPLQQNRDQFALSQIYQEQGYAFVQVRPDAEIDDERRIADVTYRISQGEKAYIGRIEFQGNRETRDYVLRREFEVRENELYDGRKLRVSQQNLTRLGYFKPSLRVDTEPTEVDNVLDVVTKVEETQTGTLQAQIGYSDQSGAVISFSVSKGNFLGRGQTLRTSAQWAQKNVTQDFSVDFIEPHLFGSEYSSESSVAYRTVEDQSELDRGIITEVRASQGVGHPIYGPLEVNLSLSAVNRTFEDEDEPDVQLRTFTTALTWDTVNHPIFPTAGTSATVAVSQIGGRVLDGTTEYRRYRLRFQRFVSLNEASTLVFMGRLRLGWLEQVGDNEIPSEDRFRLGGISTIRGYEFNEVGGPFGARQQDLNSVTRVALDERGQPVLDSEGDPVLETVDARTLGLSEAQLELLRGGGTFERLVNLELLFPLAGDNVRGVVFYDAGQVNAENEQYTVLGEEEPGLLDLEQSVGTGVRLITPLGVFRFEYGRKLGPEKGETPDKFDFTISTLF